MPERNDEFDGYRKWLGIANKKRPPTHYELLAISLDEDDPEVIRAAAEQRRHYVETKRGDGHDSVVTEILFAIGEAEATLLNDEMRRDYDRQLNLFEKRRKNRQVDPYAPHSRVSSIPGRTVGEDSGIVKTFAGIMAIVCVGFGVMAWFSFQLPWSRKPEQPIAAAPAAPVLPVVEPRKADEHAPLATPSPDAILDAQPKPSPPTEQTPQPTFLTTLPRIGLRSHPNDWWSDKGELVLGGTNGTSFIRRPLMFEGRPSPHGIYMHGLISSKVFVKCRLDGRFETFESTVHVPDMLAEQGDPRTPLVFQVVADENKLLWQSNPLKKKGEHQPCVVSVKGVNVLSLKIDCQGPDNWALGAWIEPQVYGTAIEVTPPTAAASLAPPVEAKRLDMPLPEFLNLDEINSEEAEASPWISPDGLVLYWTAKEVGGKDGDNWIWSASRKTPDARFEARTKLFRGTFPVVSSDGLEMIFKPSDFDGFSVANRKAVSDPFGRPHQIAELSIAGSYSKPRCLSHNGRSLYFDRDKPNGKNNDTWVTTRANRGAKWQAPAPLKYAIPGISQEARFTQVCLTQNELSMFCTAAFPKTGTDEDIHPAVLSRETPDGEFTSYQRLTLGNDARDISGWRVFRYCETTKEFVITDKGRRNDLFLVRNGPFSVVDQQASNSQRKSVKETETDVAASSWKFWDVFGKGAKKDSLIVSRDGMLLSPAHEQAFCLTTLKEYSGMDLKLEFQFQSADGLANPYVGVVSTLPNPAASDWKQQIPRSVQIKLDPRVAGELVLPTADFKVKLNEVQKIHNARHIAPINKAEVKLREWNTLEVKCSEDSKLIVKINGVTVNRLDGMQSNKGHVVIWPANAEMRLRNAVVVVDGSETKLSFEDLDDSLVAANAPEAAESKLAFSAVRISIAKDGSGKLIVDSREPNEIQAEESKGESIKIPALGDAKVVSEGDGSLRVLYDFSEFNALDQLKAPSMNPDEVTLFKQIRIDADEKALVFNPGSLGKVRLRFPRPVQGPLDMNLLLKGASEGVVQLQFGNGQDVLIVSLHGKNSPEKEAAGTVLAAMKTGNNFAPLIRANQPIAQRKEFDFKVKPAWSQERTAILLAYQGDVPIAIPRLEVTAKMIPSFGIALAQKGKRVIAEKVLDGSAGAAAGVKSGDTILKINGKANDDVAGAMKILGESPLDKDAVFEIERFGKKQTINVTPK